MNIKNENIVTAYYDTGLNSDIVEWFFSSEYVKYSDNPQAARKVCYMRLAGCSYREISEKLNVSTYYISKVISRVRRDWRYMQYRERKAMEMQEKTNEKHDRLKVLADMLRLCAGCGCEICEKKYADEDCANTYNEAADMLDEYARLLNEKGKIHNEKQH